MLRAHLCRIVGGVRLGYPLASRRVATRAWSQRDHIPQPTALAQRNPPAGSRCASTEALRTDGRDSVSSASPSETRVQASSRSATVRAPPLPPAAKIWTSLGLNEKLSRQVAAAFPHIVTPTIAQDAVVRAIQKQADIILRAHTGTGKSFGILLALLNMPRLTIVKGGEKRRAISSIVVVPSRELALQYELWTKQLFPQDMHGQLSQVVAARFRSREVTIKEQLDTLSAQPPHVLVITATLLQELLKDPLGSVKLGIHTLRTLVLDEVDALLDLPDRFPSKKQIWNHMKHPPAGLSALDTIMRQRSTFSGGLELPSSGLETPRSSSVLSESVRRNAHRGAEQMHARRDARAKTGALAPPLPRVSTQRPLQLVAMSATANSVLRHFLGSRTGWLRTGLRNEEGEEIGKWIDVTGQSKRINKADEVQKLWSQIGRDGEAKEHLQLPRELQHSCIVIDESLEGEGGALTLRDLDPSVAFGAQIYGQGKAAEEDNLEGDSESFAAREAPPSMASERHVVAPTVMRDGSLDMTLLMALAQIFASQGVKRGVAFIPPSWSMTKTQEFLEQLEVPVRDIVDATPSSAEEEVLYLTHSTAARGLDIPGGVSHVFNIGVDAVRDTKLYTHLAGRAGRIGRHVFETDQRALQARHEGTESTAARSGAPQLHRRAPGDVITLVRGLSTQEVRHNMRRKRLLREMQRKVGSVSNALPTKTPNSSAPVPATRLIIASSELKMARIYRYLSLGLSRVVPRITGSPETTNPEAATSAPYRIKSGADSAGLDAEAMSSSEATAENHGESVAQAHAEPAPP